jgi:omega-amidase
MKISLVQFDIIWENRNANLEKLDNLLLPLKGSTDIIILPEMYTTGFSVNPESISEEPGAETCLWMKKKAREGSFAICGSYIINEGENFFNRFIFISPDGKSWRYDKRHLFSLSGENRTFTPGIERIVFEYGGLRICPMICYDLRFPVWSRNKNEYDLLIYVSNWPYSRQFAWNTLVRARAIENQCFVAAVNRIGRDGNNTEYRGESALIGFAGRTIIAADEISEGVITGSISLQELSAFRDKYPFLDDADEFFLTS